MSAPKLHVVRLGPTETPVGPRTVMLHGLLIGNLATWYFGPAQVLARTREVVLYDLRGHGRSERPPTGYGLVPMSEDLASLTGDGPVDLVGHSWGALVAMRYAIDHPGRVRRIVIVEAPLPPTTPDEITAFRDLPPEEALAALPEGVRGAIAAGKRQAVRWLTTITGLSQDTSLVADIAATPAFTEDELRRLPACTLVYGDASSTRGSAAHLAETVPGAKLVWLPGTHWLPVEQTQALTEVIVAALAEEGP